MLRRALLLLPAALTLSGCLTVISARQGDGVPQEQLREESKSIVLMHTSLHETSCQVINMVLAKRDADGQWVRAEMFNIKGQLDSSKLPSQFVLSAGTYGIVNLACIAPRFSRIAYITKQLTRGSIIDGSGATFDKPIATFTVMPGEVVDIGSLRMPSREVPTEPGQRPQRVFIGVVTALPDNYLSNLAEKSPDIYQRRVTRPMAAAIKI